MALKYLGLFLMLTYVLGPLDYFCRTLFQLRPRPNPNATTYDFRVGQAVLYVPPQAQGEGNHPACVNGYVSSIHHPIQLLFFRQHINGPSIPCSPSQLI